MRDLFSVHVDRDQIPVGQTKRFADIQLTSRKLNEKILPNAIITRSYIRKLRPPPDQNHEGTFPPPIYCKII